MKEKNWYWWHEIEIFKDKKGDDDGRIVQIGVNIYADEFEGVNDAVRARYWKLS
jgi:hypothetical protein